MSEKVSEQSEGITTSLTGLTCKPLAILSETISTREMSMTRGGWDTIPSMLDSLAVNEDIVTPPKDPTAGAPDPTNEGGGSSTGSSVSTLGWNIGLWWPSSGSSESDTTSENNDEDHSGDFWDFDYLDDDTEDECIVPYDCGDEENDEDNNEEGSGLPDEENSTEGNNG